MFFTLPSCGVIMSLLDICIARSSRFKSERLPMQKVGALLCVMLCWGCVPSTSEYAWNEFHREFFHTTTAKMVERFRGYDLETQFELFIVGNQIVHPPTLHLAREIAKRGPSLVPFLRRKLATTKNELTIRDIVLVLVEMDHLKLYDVSKDTLLIALAEKRTASMQSLWKSTTQRYVEEIRNSSR